MKRGTPSHPKTLALAAALGLQRWGVVGILESLWHFASQYARRGDVGRHPDAAIAGGIGWTGDPEILIAALIASGWLDSCPCHRLRIHDWPVHADRGVSNTHEVKAAGFLECYVVPVVAESLSDQGPAVAEPRLSHSSAGAHLATATATAQAQATAQGNGNGGGVQGGGARAGPVLAEAEPQLRDYVNLVWGEHCKRRGGELPLMSSPEYELVRSWFEAKIPVRIVLRGFKDTKAAKPNLNYYGPSVTEAAAHWRKTKAG